MRAICGRGWVLALALETACASGRYGLPPVPAPLAARPDLSHVCLAVEEVSVSDLNEVDLERGARRQVTRVVLEHLSAAARYRGLVPSAALAEAWPDRSPACADVAEPPRLSIAVRAKEEVERTIIFDVLFFYPYTGIWPFTPIWGHAETSLTWTLRSPGRTDGPHRLVVRAPFSALFYSYYRPGVIEDAFARAHGDAFRRAAQEIAESVGRLASPPVVEEAPFAAAVQTASVAGPRSAAGAQLSGAQLSGAPASGSPASGSPIAAEGTAARAETASVAAAGRPRGSGIAAPEDPRGVRTASAAEPPGQAGAAPARAPPIDVHMASTVPAPGPLAARPQAPAALALAPASAPPRIVLEAEGFAIITGAPVRLEDDLFSRTLAALGGLEGGLTRGSASVSSRARTAAGHEQLVGAGSARARGWRVSFYAPPKKTGFFFPPSLGFLSQDITISGFRESLPLTFVPGADTIPARVTDPSTGAPVDIGAPITYELALKSAALGQGIGLNLVAGTADVQLFGTLRGSLNLFEVRHMDVRIDESRASGASVAFFQSGNVGAQLGLALPSLHLAARVAAEASFYAAFRYPRPLEFQAEALYDPVKRAFQRERVFVDGAGLDTFDLLFSIVALY